MTYIYDLYIKQMLEIPLLFFFKYVIKNRLVKVIKDSSSSTVDSNYMDTYN